MTACKYEDLAPEKAPLPPALVKSISAKGMGVNSPILVRIFKEESELEVWKQTTSGRYAHLKTYPMCAWSGSLGPKFKEGDRQAPEGFYTVGARQLNPNSSYHLSLDMGYPNTFDRANGRTGSHLMIHGSCNSSGCYAMDDVQVQEIYGLARNAFMGGQREFQIQAFPFRMTPGNMARYANAKHADFWRNLKQGSDYFEATKLPPAIGVCDRRYVFAEDESQVSGLSATGPCPQIEPGPQVAAKMQSDAAAYERRIAAMAPSEFAQVRTFSYQTGQKISKADYLLEQNRRAGYDRYGNRTGQQSIFSMFGD